MKTRIQELREEKNLSQTSLALQVGTSQATLSKIENGTSTPDAELVVLLANYFRVSVDYLLCVSDIRFTVETQFHQSGIPDKYIRLFAHYQKLSIQQRTALNVLLEGIINDT